MKISTIVPIAGLMMLPVIVLAQTSEIQATSIQPATTVTSTQTTETPTKCEVISFRVGNECGLGMYTSVNFLCSDGEKAIIGDGSSCKDVDVWHKYANEACANRYCSNGYISQPLQTATSEKPIEPVIPELPVSTSAPKPTTPGVTSTQTTVAATSPSTKCGVNSFAVSNECGLGVYKNVYAQCYDGYETNLGASETSCKTADTWNQYAKEACSNHCSNGGISGTTSTGGGSGTALTPVSTPVIYASGDDNGGGNRSTPLIPLATPAPAREWVSVCSISDRLMQNYNEIILELKNKNQTKKRRKF